MKKLSRGGLIRYLLYLALVTSVLTSVTLARYASNDEGTGRALVASFITGTTLEQDISLDGVLGPGDSKSVTFDVTNYQDAEVNNVMLNYDIQVETTGNLPLDFSITERQQINADGQADSDVDVSRLAGALDPTTLTATGGLLPPAGEYGKKIHTYTLTISWPADDADEGYSDEIDRVTLRITSAQGVS